MNTAWLIKFYNGTWESLRIFTDKSAAERFLNQERSKLPNYAKAYKVWQALGDDQRSEHGKRHPQMYSYTKEQREAADKEWFATYNSDKEALCSKFKGLLPEIIHRGPLRFEMEEVQLG